MKIKMLLAAATAGVMFAGSSLASTLDDVRARGKLNCIINTGLAGFAAPDDKGKWTGFDVDFCSQEILHGPFQGMLIYLRHLLV